MLIIREKTLDEKLEPASKQQFKLLQQQIDNDPEMRRMLTTPMAQIPQYEWIFRYELRIPMMGRSSLLDALIVLAVHPKVKLLLFSKAGNKFTGFLVYSEQGSIITDIKTASFFDDRSRANPVLAADLSIFLDREIPKRSKIHWLADIRNVKAVTQYDNLLNKKKYNWTKATYKGSLVQYTVVGNKSVKNNFNHF